ncbi:MAG: antibiotic biosynthesis monooxygenase [Actinobacteria bacterium]|nr:antibiotic biosynthesis monooxygenase [Actinomycetota bacterium]
MSNVSVVATITAKPGRGDEIIAAFEGATEAVQAEAGTLMYALHRNQANPDVFYVTELYEDQAALDAHMVGPAMAALAGIGDAVDGVDLQFATPVAVAKGW